MDAVEILSEASGLSAEPRASIAAAWSSALVTARSAWPQVELDEVAFARFVGERLAGSELAAALGAAPIADLAIAAACAGQAPSAHVAFETVLTEVDAAGAATRAGRDVIDEVKQLVRVQLLVVRDGKPAGIAAYRGKGSLRGWVRITAVRELIRQQKKRSKDVTIDRSLERALGGFSDPMLSQLKAEYRSEFATALHEAIDELSAEDRTLLRQQITDGLSIDAIGAAFGVHRATAARWLQRARAALVTKTRARLAQRLEISVDEIDSVIRLVQSRLDASVVRLLGDR